MMIFKGALSRFSTSRLFLHEQTFFAANIILRNNNNYLAELVAKKKSRNTFYFWEAKKLANQSHC